MDRPARVQLAPARADLRSAVVGHRQQRVIGRDFDRTFWTSSGSSTQSRSIPRALLPAPAECGHRPPPAGRAQRQYPSAWQRRLSARLSSNRTPIPARHHWHSAHHDHRAYRRLGERSARPGASLSVTLKIKVARGSTPDRGQWGQPAGRRRRPPCEVMHGATQGHGPLRRERAGALYAA